MRILVGAPVAHRAWIIKDWYEHAVTACAVAGVEVAFIVAAHRDDPTPRALADAIAGRHDLHVVEDPLARLDGRREQWTPARYVEMAAVRNRLLGEVRHLHPDVFVSVDSDILVHPASIGRLIELLDRFDAVGGACFMSAPPRRRADGQVGSPSFAAPSYAQVMGARYERAWQPGKTKRVDVIMAFKVMSPAAYHVDYAPHTHGEDYGWSAACRASGLRLGWDSTVVSKHVRVIESHCGVHASHDATCDDCTEPIRRVDPRCGY